MTKTVKNSRNFIQNLNELNLLNILYQTTGKSDMRQNIQDPSEFQNIIKERTCKLYFFLFLFFWGLF